MVWDRNYLVILLPFMVWLADIGLYTFLEVSVNECPLIKSIFCRYWYRIRSGPVWPHQGRQRLHPEAREDHQGVPQFNCSCEWTMHTFVPFSFPALLLLTSDNPLTPRHFLHAL